MKPLILLFTLGLILLFAACVPTADVEPANSNVFDVATVAVRPSATLAPLMEIPTPPATATNTPTLEPTLSPTATIDPTALTTTPWSPDPVPSPTPAPPFPGMVYTTDEGLWRVNADWQPELLFDRPGVLEPNGHRLLYEQDGDIWLTDLNRDTQQNLTNTPNTVECCPQWWSNKPDTFLVMKRDPVREFQLGQMTAVTLDGDYQVLVEDFTDTLPAISPDGQTIAFEIGGRPALYHQNGEIEWLTLQPAEMSPAFRAGNPVWSTDGQQLAWIAYFSNDEGRIVITVLIYELNTSDIQALHPYFPVGHDSWGAPPVWHPDSAYITLFAIDEDQTRRGLWVLGTDNSFEFNLGEVDNPMWSSDGRYFIYQSDGVLRLTYPPEFTDKIRVTLPPGARVIDWQEPP